MIGIGKCIDLKHVNIVLCCGCNVSHSMTSRCRLYFAAVREICKNGQLHWHRNFRLWVSLVFFVIKKVSALSIKNYEVLLPRNDFDIQSILIKEIKSLYLQSYT